MGFEMNCITYLREEPAVFTIGSSTRCHSSLNVMSQCSDMDLLTAVGQIARNNQSGEWEALQLGYYFGPASEKLQFKEVLVPFVWAARQQMIGRVGSRYCQLTLTQRTEKELELLWQLDVAFGKELSKLEQNIFLNMIGVEEAAILLSLPLVFVRYPKIILKMVSITSSWVDSIVRELDN